MSSADVWCFTTYGWRVSLEEEKADCSVCWFADTGNKFHCVFCLPFLWQSVQNYAQ